MASNHEILKAIEELNVENNEIATVQLPILIKNIYENYKNNLSDWQKVKLADAIAAYHMGWLYLSRFSLFLIFEIPENISHEPDHIRYLKEASQKINIQKLIEEL